MPGREEGVTSSQRAVVCCIALVLGAVALACGPIAPPESCEVGGTADEDLFAELFAEMSLVDTATGAPGETGDEGTLTFAAGTGLAVRADTLAGVSVRACVQGRTAGADIAADVTETLTEGRDEVSLGSFSRGSYVVRVIVDGVLVKNLAFEVN